jgi:hypothetical protein
MAQKVKIICGVDPERLEAEINEFIIDKKVVDIKYQTYKDRVLIIYEE